MLGPSRTRGVPRAVTMESSLISKDESPVVVEAVEVDELGPVSYCELGEGSPNHGVLPCTGRFTHHLMEALTCGHRGPSRDCPEAVKGPCA